MECDLNGDSGDAMNSNTSASDRSALYATASRTRSREQIHINSGSHCHDDVDTILRTRSSSVGALHSCQIQPKVSRRERMRKALKLWRLRKRWEKEFDKQRSLPGPFAPVHVKDKRGSIHASLLLLFAVMQCICGFVFPFCDAFALNDTRTLFAVNHKYYLEIFLQSQYVGAILVLAYLQTLIWYYNGFKSKKQRTDRKTHETDNLAENYVPLNRVNKHVIPEESLEPEPNGESDQSRSMVERLRFNFTNLEHRISEASSSRGTDNKNLSWHKEGMNLYLRLGAVGFGLGVMIHDGFNLSSEWELGQPSCHSELWIPKHVLRLIWVLWQTYFVFKYHRIILHVHKFFVRLAFTHLAAVNLCHWIKAVISEISESLKRAEASHTETQASAMVTPAHMLGTQPNWVSMNATKQYFDDLVLKDRGGAF